MLGLHARRDAEPGEARDVGVRDELRMLDRAGRAGDREGVQRVGVRDIPDRVDRARQPRTGGGGHQLDEPRRVDREQTVVERVARVRVRARGRAGAERSVGDHLERADTREIGCRAGNPVAGPQPFGDRTVEMLGVDSELDAERVEAISRPSRPRTVIPRHVEVDEAHDAAGSGIRRHRGDELVAGARVDLVESARDLEGGGFAEQPVPSGSNPSRRSAALLSQTLCTSALMR